MNYNLWSPTYAERYHDNYVVYDCRTYAMVGVGKGETNAERYADAQDIVKTWPIVRDRHYLTIYIRKV